MKDPKLVSLFPYQIKNRDGFYFRNHPKNLHPSSSQFINYWKAFRDKCIEGAWINDKGTWVYMMPKMFFYINYVKISMDEGRDFAPPRLRDNEWIFFSYIMCFDGFSGFEEDENYTCHFYVKRIEDCANPKIDEKSKRPLNEVEWERIPGSCKKADGTYKKFVDPWHYLTRLYLVEHPVKKPLGLPLYENVRKNGCVLSSRSAGKSFVMFMGDFLHEFLFNGAKRIKDIKKVNDKLLFGMGAADSEYIKKSIGNVSSFYDRMPGQYRFQDPKKSKYMGPLYKKVQGTWKTGSETSHIVKFKNGRAYIDSSAVYISVLTKDRTKVGAGDRFRRIYIEEFGFLGEAMEVHAANKDSLMSEGTKVGSAVYLGTGGSLEKIKQPKQIFENPDAYDIFGIPNYWENENKKIGLFIPIHYAKGDYKDKQGNTRLEEVHKELLIQRKIDIETMDSISFDTSISYNPMEPKEILRSNSGSMMPKREMQDQLSKLDTFDIFKKKAQIGSLKYDILAENGVSWEKDMENKLRPILDFDFDTTPGFNKDGAWIIYEQPPANIPDDLYWAIYDPAKKSGDGESYHSILIYKGMFTGYERTLYDTIVAEILCRKETLDENYHEVIKGAKYFNARIFPEINVAGFVEWCKHNKFWNLLEGDAYQIEEEISPGSKRSYYRVGCDMNSQRKKQWAFRRLRDWLLEVKEHDPISGIPIVRTIDWIFSKRILNEGIAYEDGENYDHISSLLVLMVLLGKLQGSDPVDLRDNDEWGEDPALEYIRLQQENLMNMVPKTVPKFLKY